MSGFGRSGQREHPFNLSIMDHLCLYFSNRSKHRLNQGCLSFISRSPYGSYRYVLNAGQLAFTTSNAVIFAVSMDMSYQS
jgi:hypothetical protein